MITEEERQSIINEAVEKALLMLPEVVGNLIVNQMTMLKLNKQFYEKNPAFAANKQLVASIVEKVEGENLGLDYQAILDKAVPVIKDQLKTASGLDFKTISKPSRDLSSIDIGLSDHGEL